MNTPPDENQAKRNASFRSRFFTSRGLTVMLLAVGKRRQQAQGEGGADFVMCHGCFSSWL